MKKGKRIVSILLVASLAFGIVGCSKNSTQQEEKKQMPTTGSAVTEKAITGSAVNTEVPQIKLSTGVEQQLQVIADNSKIWSKREDLKEPYQHYAITDLDQNGRLEIIASSGTQGSGQFTTTEYFQVNEAKDGVQKIKTDYGEEWASEEDVVYNLEIVYYDEKKQEYYYITGDSMTGGLATGYYKSVVALSLQDNQMKREFLGSESCEPNKKGKLKSTFRKRVDGREKKISKAEFSKEQLGDEAYKNCGKMTANISWFQFESNIKKMPKEHMLYYLKKSCQEFSLGNPLVQKKKKIYDFSVKVPQYTNMTDKKKQKKLNQMIVRAVKEDFERTFDLKNEPDFLKKNPFHLWEFDCHIKLNTEKKLSLLVEASGYGKDAAHPIAWAYTINVDCENEKLLSQTDILPKENRKEIEESIMSKRCRDIKNIGYRKFMKENHDGKLLSEDSEWEYVEVYQTPECIGVVIPTAYALGSYQIYEVWVDTFRNLYENVDWTAYQYKLSAKEYKILQEYLPVLIDETTFIWNKSEEKTQEVNMSQFLNEWKKDAEIQTIDFVGVLVCDLTEDGEEELILSFYEPEIKYLFLHKEGNRYYGRLVEQHWLYGLQANGAYCVEKNDADYFYKITFENGIWKDEELGREIYDEKSENSKYYIDGKETTEEEWDDKVWGGDVTEYSPFMLEE